MNPSRDALLIALAAAVACACGDDEPIPIEQIPEETRLVELTTPEYQGVCDWVSALAYEKLPPGTSCGSIPITYSGCMRPPPDCPGTVGQWMACVPVLLDRFAADPCVVLDFAFSPAELAAFVEMTPGCEMLGSCSTAMGMGAQ